MVDLMEDQEVLAFLRARAEEATFVGSICTGSLVLGAAGLLRGRKATTHWAWTDMLVPLGAIPTKGRVVRDGKFFTGGGVTAGIDFALTMVAELAGQDAAESDPVGDRVCSRAPVQCRQSGHRTPGIGRRGARPDGRDAGRT